MGHGVLESSISTRELERGLDYFLKAFSAESATKGAVLVKSVPPSRIRKSGAQTFSPRIPIRTSLSRAIPSENCDGAYSIDEGHRDETIQWVTETEKKSNADGLQDMAALEASISSGKVMAAQCIEMRSTPQGLRQGFEINMFPISAPDVSFREKCQEAGASHIYGSYVSISPGGGIMYLRTAFANLTTIIFHHRGEPRHWIVIPAREKGRFEDKIRDEILKSREGAAPCSQFVRHHRLWIKLEVLRRWGIEFFEVKQEMHELLFIFPGTYWYGFSEGFSIVESKVYAGNLWEWNEIRFCNTDSELCRKDNLLAELPSTIQVADRHGPNAAQTARGKKRKLSPKVGIRDESSKNGDSISRMLPRQRGSGGGTRMDYSGVAELEWITDVRRPSGKQHQLSPMAAGKGNIEDAFTISDDEDDAPLGTATQSDGRVLQLQQENVELLRDNLELRRERDTLKNRKDSYKLRLLEREKAIESLETKVVELEASLSEGSKVIRLAVWKEMAELVKEKMDEVIAEQ